MENFNCRECAHITHLQIYYENITTISNDTFSFLVNLEALSLNQIALEVIEPNSFAGLDQLETLVIANNSLTTLSEQLLEPLVQLQNLYFENNGIVKIPIGFLDKNINLYRINFNERLGSFCRKIFNNLTELHVLSLTSNPCIGNKAEFERADYANGSYDEMLKDIRLNTANCQDSCPIVTIHDCSGH